MQKKQEAQKPLNIPGFNIVYFVDEFQKGIPKFEQKWTVIGLFASGTKRGHILSAYAHAGKSTLGTQLVVAVATGEPFLNFETVCGRAVYWGTEDNQAEILDRIQTQGGDLKTNIAVGASLAVSRKQNYEELRLLIDGMQARTDSDLPVRLCVIETSQEFFQPEDGSNEEWGRLLREFNRFIQNYPEVAFVVLHQFNKGEHGDSLLKRISGAAQIVANTHTKLCMEVDEERDSRRLFVVYPRNKGQSVPPTYLNFDPQTQKSSVGELRSEVRKREKRKDEADNFYLWGEAADDLLARNPQGLSQKKVISGVDVPLKTERKLEAIHARVVAETWTEEKGKQNTNIYRLAPSGPAVKAEEHDALFDATKDITVQ